MAAAKSLFKLETLHKVEHLAEDFDAFLAAAVGDCKERPGMQKRRKITIDVDVLPDKEDPQDVVVVATVGSKMPARSALAYKMQSTANNGLKFAPSSPLEPDQGELFDE